MKFVKHGMVGTKVYRAWCGMRQRCSNRNIRAYLYYGARGIKVCERWQNSFEAFLHDMGEPPTDKHSLDRINNDAGYAPMNCRWATWEQQANNKRPSGVRPEWIRPKKHGNCKPNPKSAILKFRVPAGQKAVLQAKANEQGESLTDFVTKAIQHRLDEIKGS